MRIAADGIGGGAGNAPPGHIAGLFENSPGEFLPESFAN